MVYVYIYACMIIIIHQPRFESPAQPKCDCVYCGARVYGDNNGGGGDILIPAGSEPGTSESVIVIVIVIVTVIVVCEHTAWRDITNNNMCARVYECINRYISPAGFEPAT